MSTIPSTPDPDERYTIVGAARGGTPKAGTGLLILNRSSRLLRRELLQELSERGFADIVSVESQEHSYTVESLSREFPAVRFILMNRRLSVGAQINLGMRHLQTGSVLVQWSTMEPPQGIERAEQGLKDSRMIVIAPQLRSERSETIPAIQAPAMQGRTLRVLNLPLRTDRQATLFPFDYVGLYDRDRTLRIGGFDEALTAPYWQKLDFGFRVHLWGGEIVALSAFRARYQSMPEPEDQTSNESYARFFARNLAPRMRDGRVVLPRLQWVAFALRTGFGLFRSYRVFREAGRWLHDARSQFVTDSRTLVDSWSAGHV